MAESFGDRIQKEDRVRFKKNKKIIYRVCDVCSDGMCILETVEFHNDGYGGKQQYLEYGYTSELERLDNDKA